MRVKASVKVKTQEMADVETEILLLLLVALLALR